MSVFLAGVPRYPWVETLHPWLGWGQGSILKGEALDLVDLTFNGELGPS